MLSIACICYDGVDEDIQHSVYTMQLAAADATQSEPRGDVPMGEHEGQRPEPDIHLQVMPDVHMPQPQSTTPPKPAAPTPGLHTGSATQALLPTVQFPQAGPQSPIIPQYRLPHGFLLGQPEGFMVYIPQYTPYGVVLVPAVFPQFPQHGAAVSQGSQLPQPGDPSLTQQQQHQHQQQQQQTKQVGASGGVSSEELETRMQQGNTRVQASVAIPSAEPLHPVMSVNPMMPLGPLLPFGPLPAEMPGIVVNDPSLVTAGVPVPVAIPAHEVTLAGLEKHLHPTDTASVQAPNASHQPNEAPTSADTQLTTQTPTTEPPWRQDVMGTGLPVLAVK
ncbi:tyrosine-protein phosphatase non-receptor type 23-like isoform X2 [Engraulis encrasicolus]|uniref:tyrosine-protein phosphatase non-receptor type 23-like isoform X2 n=1 Tax=Engraulis encrasicolus TaxID=184585 RepID=UPI002FD255A1